MHMYIDNTLSCTRTYNTLSIGRLSVSKREFISGKTGRVVLGFSCEVVCNIKCLYMQVLMNIIIITLHVQVLLNNLIVIIIECRRVFTFLVSGVFF